MYNVVVPRLFTPDYASGNMRLLGDVQDLIAFGPRVEVILDRPIQLGASEDPLTGYALLDTGARGSAIDIDVAKSLGLFEIGKVPTYSPLGREDSPQCQASLSFVDTELQPLSVGCRTFLALKLQDQQLVAILGRDFLRAVTLTYDGVAGSFSIAYVKGARRL